MNSALNLFKFCTFFINIIILISGISVTWIGAHGLCEDSFKEDKDLKAILIGMTVVGSLIMVFSLIGCCALITENNAMLHMYTFFSFVAAILLLAIGIMSFVFKNRVTDNEDKKMSEIFKEYHKTIKGGKDVEKDEKIINEVQTKLKCCGWEKTFNKSSAFKYPSSCDCVGSKDNCKSQQYANKCKKLFKNYIANTMLAAGWFCIISLIFPIICAVTTSKIASKLKDYQSFSE